VHGWWQDDKQILQVNELPGWNRSDYWSDRGEMVEMVAGV